MYGILPLLAGGEELAAHDVGEHMTDHIERDRSASVSHQRSVKMHARAPVHVRTLRG
jgi:hypothetical protein